MTNNQEPTITIVQSVRNAASGLAIFALFTAGIIAITYQLTGANIQQNQRDFEARLLLTLLPDTANAEQVLASAQTFVNVGISNTALLNTPPTEQFYQLVNEAGSVTDIILSLEAPNAYTESIRLIVGINQTGSLTGVRVTRHKETPGLGDQIEIGKSPWILSFNNTSLVNPEAEGWRVKKDGGEFDQMTGATITPRAIVKAVYQALLFFDEHKAQLLTLASVEQEEA